MVALEVILILSFCLSMLGLHFGNGAGHRCVSLAAAVVAMATLLWLGGRL